MTHCTIATTAIAIIALHIAALESSGAAFYAALISSSPHSLLKFKDLSS